MHLLSESAKEKLERERFMSNYAMKSRKLGISTMIRAQLLSRLEAEALYPRFDLLPCQQQLMEQMLKNKDGAMTVFKGRSPGLSTLARQYAYLTRMRFMVHPNPLKKQFNAVEAAKACRMAIDVISDEWLDEQFGGAE